MLYLAMSNYHWNVKGTCVLKSSYYWCKLVKESKRALIFNFKNLWRRFWILIVPQNRNMTVQFKKAAITTNKDQRTGVKSSANVLLSPCYGRNSYTLPATISSANCTTLSYLGPSMYISETEELVKKNVWIMLNELYHCCTNDKAEINALWLSLYLG